MLNPNIPLFSQSFYTANNIDSTRNIIFLQPTEEACIKAYDQCSFFGNKTVVYFPSLDIGNYERNFSSFNIQLNRTKILTKLALGSNNEHYIIITHAKNFSKKLPPLNIFIKNSMIIESGKRVRIESLLIFLIENGFIRAATASNAGEFAVRGQIIDIVLETDKGYRILFNIDNIEEIKLFDLNTQLSFNKTDKFIISPFSEIILNEETLVNFKNNYLLNFGVNHTKDLMFTSIMESRKFPGYENLLPLFYEKLTTLLDLLTDPIVVYDSFSKQSLIAYHHSYLHDYEMRLQANKIDKENFYPVLSPSVLNVDLIDSEKILNHPQNILFNNYDPEIEPIFIPFAPLLHQLIKKNQALNTPREKIIFDFIKLSINNKKILIFCKLRSQLEKIKNYILHENLKFKEILHYKDAEIGVINLALIELEQGFLTDGSLLLPYSEVFNENHSESISSFSAKKRLKNILIELEGIEAGEYVIHKEHGIGQFLALENVTVEGIKHDCIKILYAGNAKLYIPVENIENIKKYGHHEAELDRLGSTSWQKRKAKLKEKITEIATKILSIAAMRKSQQVSPIVIDQDEYTKFSQKFNYIETEDQLRAIDEIKNDLFTGKIMDRLICGDVGFGKTEVALRAAFLVASDKSEEIPQVAIIVPTTILCKQHYLRCVERFEDTTLNINELSRFVSPNQVKLVKENITSGKVNIVIGTHALLSKDVKFYNLKLLIIDEEQHFGVLQKERLKELKSSIHVLSLSATPIPRTLQMSMVGLKELSLIATAPVGRLPIKTMVLPFDHGTIKQALLNEYLQGGKSFYVVPQIRDIPEVEKRIKQMVPNLTYRIIHGGLAASQIEKLMSEFYHDKIDILLSTAIIESGIDIATANTIIIHRSDLFGLSQIYQLRGRIGRSKKKAFAYLTLEKNKITEKARKRLEIMNNIENGSGGFTIASYDMDFRGYGNLIGKEQAGHIKEVGIELYQEMLDEQLLLLGPNNASQEKAVISPVINLGIPIFITEEYITDTNLRLGIYRRLGDLSSDLEIDNFVNEMIDRFGLLPLEFQNLIGVLRIKLLCLKLNIGNLDVSDKGAVFKFSEADNLEELILPFVQKFPMKARIRPNNKLIFIQNFDKSNIIDEVLELLNKF